MQPCSTNSIAMFNFTTIRIQIAVTIDETCDGVIQNLNAKSSTNEPILKRIKTKRNSCSIVKSKCL